MKKEYVVRIYTGREKNFEAKPQFEEKTFTRKADMLRFWDSCEATVKENILGSGRMTEEQMIDCLLYELVKKDKAIKKKNIIITALTVMLIAISTVSIALQDHYESQINGLRTQLSRTQKQLKRASEQNQRQTKRIADLTNNGG
ncbi:hypothetical protein HMPREF1243_0113 [Streptococcus pyogenes GA03747]|nr:hypothetical protein HMPREF1243_0113 [Streptococcus pyogenes GA03747]